MKSFFIVFLITVSMHLYASDDPLATECVGFLQRARTSSLLPQWQKMNEEQTLTAFVRHKKKGVHSIWAFTAALLESESSNGANLAYRIIRSGEKVDSSLISKLGKFRWDRSRTLNTAEAKIYRASFELQPWAEALEVGTQFLATVETEASQLLPKDTSLLADLLDPLKPLCQKPPLKSYWAGNFTEQDVKATQFANMACRLLNTQYYDQINPLLNPYWSKLRETHLGVLDNTPMNKKQAIKDVTTGLRLLFKNEPALLEIIPETTEYTSWWALPNVWATTSWELIYFLRNYYAQTPDQDHSYNTDHLINPLLGFYEKILKADARHITRDLQPYISGISNALCSLTFQARQYPRIATWLKANEKTLLMPLIAPPIFTWPGQVDDAAPPLFSVFSQFSLTEGRQIVGGIMNIVERITDGQICVSVSNVEQHSPAISTLQQTIQQKALTYTAKRAIRN